MCVCVSFLLLPCIFDTLHRIFYDFIAIFSHEHSVGYAPTVYSFFSTTARLPARSLARPFKKNSGNCYFIVISLNHQVHFLCLSLARSSHPCICVYCMFNNFHRSKKSKRFELKLCAIYTYSINTDGSTAIEPLNTRCHDYMAKDFTLDVAESFHLIV